MKKNKFVLTLKIMKMKFIFMLVALIVICTASMSQTIGSKVSLTAVDGKPYTGTITDIQGGKYKIKYDGFDFEAWLIKEQFSLLNNNNQTQPKNNNIQITNDQINNQNNNYATVGKLYSGSSVNGNVYYYLLPSGKIIFGCPTGGLENFNLNAYCTTSPTNCGTYIKNGSTLNIKWNDRNVQTGKLSANGDIEINGSLIGEMQKVPNRLSASYDFSVNIGGTSIAETTKFNDDGTFLVSRVGGVDSGDGQNSAEWNSSHSGKYKINGYTISMMENNGKITSHTIYSMDKVANPDYLGWDGNFLSKK